MSCLSQFDFAKDWLSDHELYIKQAIEIITGVKIENGFSFPRKDRAVPFYKMLSGELYIPSVICELLPNTLY